MSNTDTFIDEVTEEVRRDRLFSLFRRYGWIGALVVVLIVGGATWNELRKARAAAEAQAAGEALIVALETEGAEALAAVGDSGAVAMLLLADRQAGTGDVPAAIATLDALAADAAQGRIYRDLATLKSLMLQAGTTPPRDRIAALTPLSVPGATFAGLALEQIAVAEIEAGDIDAARATLGQIAADAGSAEGLRARAEALMLALGEGGAGQD